MKRIFILVIISGLLFSADAIAGKRYWIAGTAAYWNNTANWSSSSGGAGGSSVPGASDTAYFDGNGLGNDTLDVNVSVKWMNVAAGYSGVIYQGAKTITLGTTGGLFSGGTFSGGSASITSTGAITISGTAFTSTSGTLSTNSNFTLSSGSFTHNSGRVRLTGNNTLTGNISMYDLEIKPATNATITVASGNTVTANDSLIWNGNGNGITFNTGTFSAKGHMKILSTNITAGGGTGKIIFNGTGTQKFIGVTTNNAGRLPDIQINKSASDTIKLYNIITAVGDWTYTAGIVDAGTSVVRFLSTKTITGTHALYDVLFSAGSAATMTIASGTVLTVAHTLTISGTQSITINAGTIYAQGDISVSNTGTAGGGTGLIVINGNGTQNLTGPATVNNGRLCNVQINKSVSDSLYLVNTISVAGNWTYTNGIIDAGSSTVYFSDTKTISGSHALNHVNFSGTSASTYTISSGTILTAKGDLGFDGSNAIILDTGEIDVQGNLTTSNSSTSTTGTATIVINGTGSQTLTGSGVAGAGKLPNIQIDKSAGTLTLASIISCSGNWIFVGGTVSPGTSSVGLYGNYNLDGQGTSSTMSFNRLAIGSGIRTLTGNIDVNENLNISTGTTLIGGQYTINVGGNWNGQGTWTYGSGSVVFDGSGYTKIQGSSGATVTFSHVSVNRRAAPGSMKLVNPVKIDSSMTLTLGRIITTTTNFLEFSDNATCTVTNDDSAYVCGPVRKTGDDAFTFPLGDTLLHDSIAYHPLGITAPGSATDRFQAQYLAVGQSYGSTIEDTLVSISNCEYWTLERQVGSSTVNASVSWNKNSCEVDNYDDLRLAGWDGTQWGDLGDVTVTVDDDKGMITMSSPVSFTINPKPILIARGKNYEPYAVLQTELTGGYHTVYNGKLLFKYDESYNESGDLNYTIYDDYHRPIASNVISPGVLTNGSVATGDNRYLLNLLDCDIAPNGALGTGMYLLEVINDKGEHRYLLIKHIATIVPNCPDSNPPE